MAINDLAPGFVKLTYTTPYGTHTMTIPVDPYEFSSGVWYLRQKGNTTGQEWTFLVDAYCDELAPLMADESTFTEAVLYEKTAGNAPIFRAAASIGVAGTSTTASVQASQLKFTFRSAEGGIGYVVLLDSVYPPNQKRVGPTFGGDTAMADLATFLTGSGSIVLARDTSYPVAVLKSLTKTNDELRKQYGLA